MRLLPGDQYAIEKQSECLHHTLASHFCPSHRPSFLPVRAPPLAGVTPSELPPGWGGVVGGSFRSVFGSNSASAMESVTTTAPQAKNMQEWAINMCAHASWAAPQRCVAAYS